MNKPLILVVEDDAPVRNSDHHHIKAARLPLSDRSKRRNRADGSIFPQSGYHSAGSGTADIDGIDIIRQIRSWSMTPIIVISARSEDTGQDRGTRQWGR